MSADKLETIPASTVKPTGTTETSVEGLAGVETGTELP